MIIIIYIAVDEVHVHLLSESYSSLDTSTFENTTTETANSTQQGPSRSASLAWPDSSLREKSLVTALISTRATTSSTTSGR